VSDHARPPRELPAQTTPQQTEEAAAPTPNFSRRSFLKSVGVTPIVAAALTPEEVEAQQQAQVLGPEAVRVTFVVNGERRSVNVEPRVTLLDALRTQLDLTGSKRVCDRGSCGACTVTLDGRTAYACSVLAVDAADAEIRTIEGLAEGTVLHPVQQAFCEKDGLMCGFCTPGFVMSTVALLEKVPNPTPDQARHALDGNICRCGTYVRLLEAALSVKGGARG
jgi:aerobic-type carbon monoxide dehydrogenase small subunit (CoxS/CutS family)